MELNVGLLVLRVALGSIFFVHGRSKWRLWRGKPTDMPGHMHNLLRFASILETVGSLLVLFGLYTQIDAALLAIVMLGALYFKLFVWKVPFTLPDRAGWEFDFILLASLTMLILVGGGAYSLDRSLLAR